MAAPRFATGNHIGSFGQDNPPAVQTWKDIRRYFGFKADSRAAGRSVEFQVPELDVYDVITIN